MKKIVIIDDEPLARSVIKRYLEDLQGFEIVEECGNGFEGAKAIDFHKPDLVFLDIQMPKINGFEMLEIIEHEPDVIFTTAFDEYALKAFETNAIDYLLKPFTQERFVKAIVKWGSSQSSSTAIIQTSNKQPDEHLRIVLKDGGNIQIIPTDEVIYLEAYDDYVKIHTEEKTYVKKKTMSYYEESLEKADFIRIHRSFIINLNYLNRIDAFEKNQYRATMTNGDKVPISRTSYPKLKQTLGV